MWVIARKAMLKKGSATSGPNEAGVIMIKADVSERQEIL